MAGAFLFKGRNVMIDTFMQRRDGPGGGGGFWQMETRDFVAVIHMREEGVGYHGPHPSRLQCSRVTYDATRNRLRCLSCSSKNR